MLARLFVLAALVHGCTHAEEHRRVRAPDCERAPDLHPWVMGADVQQLSELAARAADDIVFVRHDGCSLHVVDTCRLASGYGPVDWHLQPLRRLLVDDAAQLLATFPLARSFETSVANGTPLRATWRVAGLRTATTDVSSRDLADDPGCAAATHYVHAFEVGAFVLTSTASGTMSERKGGDLAACDEPLAVACQVPLRLRLRPIDRRPP